MFVFVLHVTPEKDSRRSKTPGIEIPRQIFSILTETRLAYDPESARRSSGPQHKVCKSGHSQPHCASRFRHLYRALSRCRRAGATACNDRVFCSSRLRRCTRMLLAGHFPPYYLQSPRKAAWLSNRPARKGAPTSPGVYEGRSDNALFLLSRFQDGELQMASTRVVIGQGDQYES